jgi:hypothetical protein
MPKYQMIFGRNTDIPEDVSRIHKSIKRLFKHTEGMEELKIFTSGRGIYEGRGFLRERLRELEDLHEKAHHYLQQGKKKGLKERRLKKFLVNEMFGGESFVGKFTRGDLSNQNLIQSLLEWSLP